MGLALAASKSRRLRASFPFEPYEPIASTSSSTSGPSLSAGTWNPVDLVKIAPTAADLDGLYQYLYFDARTRHELEPAHEPDELPAEIEVRPAT